MFLKIWRFVTFILAALLLGTTFCHVLEMPAKMEYSSPLYLTLHRTLYAAFGPPNIGPFIEIGATLAALVLIVLVRRHRPAVFRLTLLAAVCLVAGIAVYFAFIEPANVAMKGWAVDAAPADWTGWRDQWEYGHAAHFAFHFIGFSMLALSMIIETRTTPVAVEREYPVRHIYEPHMQSGR